MTDAPSDLLELRRELRFARSYASDELTEKIADWTEESHHRHDADTAREYVEHRLNNLLQKYKMYNAPDVGNGADAFPDKCEDCQHYGAACPVLTDGIQDRWRDRKLAEATTEKDARRVYEEQSRDVGCVLIPQFLETWDSDISDFMRRGERLLREYEQEERNPVDEDDQGDQDDDLDLEDELDLDLDELEAPAATDGGQS